MTRNRILITCAIASLALGLSACSSDDKASPVVNGPAGVLEPEPLCLDDRRRAAVQYLVANLKQCIRLGQMRANIIPAFLAIGD